jgi:crossover junction endodeoxyribonuclease RuvC
MENEERTVTQAAILGIDPGLDGAVAALGSWGVTASVTPTLAASRGGKRRFDVTGMIALLEARPVELAVIEAVGTMPRQGLASTFRFEVGYGLWLGLLAALRIPHLTVLPPAWKKVVLAGTSRNKAAAIELARRRFPLGAAPGDAPLAGTP